MDKDIRWIKLSEVCYMTTYSRSSIYRLMVNGRFPKSVSLSPRCVVWKLSDVQAWMRDKESANHPSFVEELR